ncbi:phage portal protein family protein, partial [Ornithobacterium rhinotracheale]
MHSNTENDQNKDDKIYVRRFLNQELKPRLEKRGYTVEGGFINFIDEKEHLKSIDKLSEAERV